MKTLPIRRETLISFVVDVPDSNSESFATQEAAEVFVYKQAIIEYLSNHRDLYFDGRGSAMPKDIVEALFEQFDIAPKVDPFELAPQIKTITLNKR